MDEKSNIVPALHGDEKRVKYSADEKQTEDASSDELVTVENGATEVTVDYTQEETRRILRKIDYRLVPLLGVLYLLAFIDRGNSKYRMLSFYSLPMSRKFSPTVIL
jgi:hypothetical protein